MKQRSQAKLPRVGATLAVILGLAGLLMPSAAWAGMGEMVMMHTGSSAEFRPNVLPSIIVREHDNECDWFGYRLGPNGYQQVIHPCRFADGEQDYTPSVRHLVSHRLSPAMTETAAGAEVVQSEPAAATTSAEPAAETAAQAQPASPEGVADIAMRITAGVEPGVCADAETLEVEAGTAVYYCYTVTNTGAMPLTLHNLVDSEFGLLFVGMAYDLAPGASLDTVTAGLEASAIVVENRTNNATWRAYVEGGRSVDAVAQAKVTLKPVTE